MKDIRDRLRDHSEICRMTGNQGCISDTLATDALAEINKLRQVITDAIPFIGYGASVPDILERAENAVNYGAEDKNDIYDYGLSNEEFADKLVDLDRKTPLES